jgi:hypothetical protein
MISDKKLSCRGERTILVGLQGTVYEGEEIICANCKALETEIEAETGANPGKRNYKVNLAGEAATAQSAL